MEGHGDTGSVAISAYSGDDFSKGEGISVGKRLMKLRAYFVYFC